MPASFLLLPIIVSGLGFAGSPSQAHPATAARHCALVIPPPQVTRTPMLELVYRDGLPLGPGWIIILDHLACD